MTVAHWWNLVTAVVMLLLSTAMSVLGYFLVRLIREHDASRKTMDDHDRELVRLRGTIDYTTQRAETAKALGTALGQKIEACQERHNEVVERLQRDLADRYTRVDALKDLVLKMESRDAQLRQISEATAGIMAAVQAVQNRLDEGNTEFATHKKEITELVSRVSRLEGINDTRH